MRRSVALVLLAPLLFACGGGGESYDSADAVAEAAGFTDCEPDEVLGATEAVSCDGGRVSWFKHDEGKDAFVKGAKAVGESVGGEILIGSNWAIECQDHGACNGAKGLVGGDYL